MCLHARLALLCRSSRVSPHGLLPGLARRADFGRSFRLRSLFFRSRSLRLASPNRTCPQPAPGESALSSAITSALATASSTFFVALPHQSPCRGSPAPGLRPPRPWQPRATERGRSSLTVFAAAHVFASRGAWRLLTASRGRVPSRVSSISDRSGVRPIWSSALESSVAWLPRRRLRAGVSLASAALLVLLQLGWRPCPVRFLTTARPAPFLASSGGCTLTHTFWPKYGVYGRRLTPKPAALEGSLTHTLR